MIERISRFTASTYDRKRHRDGKDEQPETVRQWLEKIPWPDIRAKAIQNTDPGLLASLAPEGTTVADELAAAFEWDSSPEGRQYWLRKHASVLYWQFDYPDHD
jgi:hypothetical protein